MTEREDIIKDFIHYSVEDNQEGAERALVHVLHSKIGEKLDKERIKVSAHLMDDPQDEV